MSVARTGILYGVVIAPVILIIFFIKSHKMEQKGYTIHGKITGIADKKVVLSILFPQPVSYRDVDTVIMHGEDFVVEGKLDEPKIALLHVVYPDGTTKGLGSSFWLENEELTSRVTAQCTH
jgi:hypothetical protein